MKKIKRRLICLLLCVCMCSSLFVYAGAIEPLDGAINADDDATLVSPILESSATPSDAVAVARNMDTGTIYYYFFENGNILSNDNTDTMTIPGYFPSEMQSNSDDGALSPNYAFEPDERVKITDADEMPYSSICYMEVTFPNGTYPATAFMISENTAMTAGHCLYNEEEGGWATLVTLYPGKSGYGFFNNPWGTADADEIVVSMDWMNTGMHEYDWGLIRLDDDIGEESGYMGFRYFATGLEDMVVRISGYPNPYGDSANYYQYEASGEIYYSADLIFNHRIDATEGQSGAPVFYWDSTEQQWIVVGIHVAERESFQITYNIGVLFTSVIFNFVNAYR